MLQRVGETEAFSEHFNLVFFTWSLSNSYGTKFSAIRLTYSSLSGRIHWFYLIQQSDKPEHQWFAFYNQKWFTYFGSLQHHLVYRGLYFLWTVSTISTIAVLCVFRLLLKTYNEKWRAGKSKHCTSDNIFNTGPVIT